MKRVFFAILTAATLSTVALIRTDGFSLSVIEGSLKAEMSPIPSEETQMALNQPYSYFGKGRQCFVFESADRRFVLKFFNQRYLRMPWYSFLVEEKERIKRSRRLHFYEKSYEIAFKELGEEILYYHAAKSEGLPKVSITDRASQSMEIDLNRVPFVLQRKGEPFYPGLEAVYKSGGIDGLKREIDDFLAAVRVRISKNIADADADVEHNWGYSNGRLFHLDPGRLYYDATLNHSERLKREWHTSTRAFYKWLKVRYPEAAEYLEMGLNKILTDSEGDSRIGS